MKKLFLVTMFFFLLALSLTPVLIKSAEPLVPQRGSGHGGAYDIDDFFTTLGNIYDFMVKKIATPLAVIALMIGGIFMLISAGNPNLMATGKKIVYAAIIGLVLVYASYLIIKTILNILGYSQAF